MTRVRMEIQVDTTNRLETAKLATGLARAAEIGQLAGVKSQVRVTYCIVENDNGDNPILISQAVNYDHRPEALERFNSERALEQLWDYELDEFDFQARTLIVLKAAGIGTIGQLYSITQGELSKLPGVGKRTLEDVKDTLSRQGIKYGSD